MNAGELAKGDRLELGGLTHTVIQVIKINDVVRVALQCSDPALVEAGMVIQGHSTCWWMAAAPVIATHSQLDCAIAAGDARLDWLDKVADQVGEDSPEPDGWLA